MSEIVRGTLAGVALLVAATSASRAAEPPICLDMRELSDQVRRTFTVQLRDAPSVTGTGSLNLDTGRARLTLEAGRGDRTVPLANVSAVEVQREVHRMSPVVQMSPWSIEANVRERFSYRLPLTELRIKDGMLSSASATNCVAPQSGAVGGQPAGGSVAEVDLVRIDAAERTVVIEGQRVNYTVSGGGGGGLLDGSGSRKGG